MSNNEIFSWYLSLTLLAFSTSALRLLSTGDSSTSVEPYVATNKGDRDTLDAGVVISCGFICVLACCIFPIVPNPLANGINERIMRVVDLDIIVADCGGTVTICNDDLFNPIFMIDEDKDEIHLFQVAS